MLCQFGPCQDNLFDSDDDADDPSLPEARAYGGDDDEVFSRPLSGCFLSWTPAISVLRTPLIKRAE
jgi:hypothetical protein